MPLTKQMCGIFKTDKENMFDTLAMLLTYNYIIEIAAGLLVNPVEFHNIWFERLISLRQIKTTAAY